MDGSLESHVLSTWYIRVGDAVHFAQVVVTVETHSFTLDLETFDSGILSEQCCAIGDVIPDGAIVARIAPSAVKTSNELRGVSYEGVLRTLEERFLLGRDPAILSYFAIQRARVAFTSSIPSPVSAEMGTMSIFL